MYILCYSTNCNEFIMRLAKCNYFKSKNNANNKSKDISNQEHYVAAKQIYWRMVIQSVGHYHFHFNQIGLHLTNQTTHIDSSVKSWQSTCSDICVKTWQSTFTDISVDTKTYKAESTPPNKWFSLVVTVSPLTPPPNSGLVHLNHSIETSLYQTRSLQVLSKSTPVK